MVYPNRVGFLSLFCKDLGVYDRRIEKMIGYRSGAESILSVQHAVKRLLFVQYVIIPKLNVRNMLFTNSLKFD